MLYKFHDRFLSDEVSKTSYKDFNFYGDKTDKNPMIRLTDHYGVGFKYECNPNSKCFPTPKIMDIVIF